MKRQHYIRIRSIIVKQRSAQVLSNPAALPQAPKYYINSKKHFLIGKDFSCLKFILPNMDHEMGGECS